MAYKSLENLGNTSKKDMFVAMRDFLTKAGAYSATGIGWTLHDSSYAVDAANPQLNDWIVIYSAGENGKEDMYHKITWTTNAFTHWTYLYWNAATNAGIKGSGGTTLTNTEASSDIVLDVNGDLDAYTIMLNSDGSASNYFNHFGKVDTFYDSTVATSAGALSSGTDIVVTVDAVPSSWVVGGHIFIRDNADIDKIEIKGISGLDVTVDLPVAYAAGCKLSQEVGYTGCASNQFGTLWKGIIDHNGQAPISNLTAYFTSFTSSTDPDTLDNDRISTDIVVGSLDTLWGRLRHIRGLHFTGLTDRDIFVDENSVTWRFFKVYSNKYICVKVV